MSKIYTNHPDVKRIATAAYPNYTGRKFSVEVSNRPIDVRSYWDGGSRDYFVFLRLDNLKTWVMPEQSINDVKVEGADKVSLVPGMVCVEHTIFCGKDIGITIYIHPDNVPKFIEEKQELTIEEKIVLVFTRLYKNTYGGQTNVRYREAVRNTGISLGKWVEAIASLQAKGLLNKAASITNEGKNAIGDMNESIVTREYKEKVA
jgi:hypothetical protein